MMLPLRIGVCLLTSLGAEEHRTERDNGDASLTVLLNKWWIFCRMEGECQDDDFMPELLAGLLVLLAGVLFSIGLLLERCCVGHTQRVLVPDVGILAANGRRVVLETVGAVRRRRWRGTWRRRVCFSGTL